MKAILSVLLSVLIAGLLCLALLKAGILKYNAEEAGAKLKTLHQTLGSGVDRATNAFENAKKRLSSSNGLSFPTNCPAEQKAIKIPESNQDEIIYKKALQFLISHKQTANNDIEDLFERFLRKNLGLNEKQVDRLVRMSFWKNFVTLQDLWHAGQEHQMELAFAREKELKQAGFAAKGLSLMKTEIDNAEARLREMRQRIARSNGEDNHQ